MGTPAILFTGVYHLYTPVKRIAGVSHRQVDYSSLKLPGPIFHSIGVSAADSSVTEEMKGKEVYPKLRGHSTGLAGKSSFGEHSIASGYRKFNSGRVVKPSDAIFHNDTFGKKVYSASARLRRRKG
jgi:hypothetical protein